MQYNITSRIILLTLLYFFLPVYLAIFIAHYPLLLLVFFLSNIFLILYLLKINSYRRYRLEYQTQGLQEKLNILNDENLKELKIQAALKAKIKRYNGLKEIVEKINEKLDLDSVADTLTSIVFSLVCGSKGVCILYLIDKQLNLKIFKTKKEDEKLVIKAKEGDIFDFWVLRHTSPLLVEDIKKDFRFDSEKLKTQKFIRPVSSLISSPLMSEHRFLGTLRLDYPQADFFSQDDLRFLVTICDLGAVALENSELFQRTQDLAIHDGLTTLYTKGYFLERLKEECIRGIHQKNVFSLLMFDIDFFKDYNDKFGHSAGDIVLKRLSQTIAESLKDLNPVRNTTQIKNNTIVSNGVNPIVSRFGGEEFCVILERLDKKKAYHFANLLRERIEKERIILRRQETKITVSIGIASFPADAACEEELIQAADKAMYEAKLKGRNQVCCI